jgi:4a-hydroxytetrahydrobiopterin dehydratase
VEARGKENFEEVKFRDFDEAMVFINKIADIAREEEHHPDFKLYEWNNVSVELWTHAVGGLSENDFIVAAKINKVEI